MLFEFIDLGFHKCHFVRAQSRIGELFKNENKCGIYILHFMNGEYYVGQAIDVVKRYSNHRKKHIDIAYLSFREVDLPFLNNIEKETIGLLEALNKPLRNISLVSIIQGETDLDLVVTKEDQEKWLRYELKRDSLETERFEYPELRRKYTDRFLALSDSVYYEPIRKALQHYIIFTIPFPRKTEYSFWSLTCLTSQGNGFVFSRVNMFWQETLSIHEDVFLFEGKKLRALFVSVFMCKTLLFAKTSEEKLLEEYSTLEFTDLIYSTGGQDQINAQISIKEFEDFLYDPRISDAIKEFNFRLLRKGGCNNRRYHNFALADEVLRIDDVDFE